jgi:hypothetical protein
MSNAKFGLNTDLGEIILSYPAINMIFGWISRSIYMEDVTLDYLNNPDSPMARAFNDIEKRKIMIIIKLLLTNEKDRSVANCFDYPSKDADIMAKAVCLILTTSKIMIDEIKEDFYGFMEFLDKRVASGEITEHKYKRGLDNCMFIGNYLNKLELIDFNDKLSGYYVNSKIDGEQLLLIRYKSCSCSCNCCHNRT